MENSVHVDVCAYACVEGTVFDIALRPTDTFFGLSN